MKSNTSSIPIPRGWPATASTFDILTENIEENTPNVGGGYVEIGGEIHRHPRQYPRADVEEIAPCR